MGRKPDPPAPRGRARAPAPGGRKLPDALDELYAGSLDEFTARRTELARRLKQEGRADEAAEVGAQKKPTLPAWLATQLARRSPEAMGRLLEAGERLVDAQRRALSGGGGPDLLREAMGAERQAIQELVGDARKIVEEAGKSVSGAMLDRLVETLRAAVVDPEGKAELARGRLTREYERSGFDALGMLGGGRAGAPPPPQQHDELAERRHRREEAERRVRELRAQVRAAGREALAAEREADRTEREAEQARARADELQTAVERLQEELEAAEAELKPRERR